MNQNQSLFKLIPKVDEILDLKDIKDLLITMPRVIVVDSIREEIDRLREDIGNGLLKEKDIIRRKADLAISIAARANKRNSYKLKRVINATGVVIHTNIGRSLIGQDAIENVLKIASNYSNLEYDLDEGKRGSRYSHLTDIITDITGGQDAMVVNNNAAAVLLVLSTLAKDREVVVSRGELIEIGGSFRIPEVMEQSGARLKAVGTTNKTHLGDFENAITEDTAALLKVHTSNYRILGFTSSVSAEDLYPLKKKYNLPLIEDLGSGVLVDLSKYGLEYEPTVQASIKNGVDLVTFSGDKLLGGPQAGIIVGKREYIDRMKKNPLTRAFRVDKFTISALEATFRLYYDETRAIKSIPTLNMLAMGIEDLEIKARKLYDRIGGKIAMDDISIEIDNTYSEVGGGSLPLEKIPSKCILLNPRKGGLVAFEKALREFKTPIITRIYKDRILIDLRTVREEEFDILVEGLAYGISKSRGCI